MTWAASYLSISQCAGVTGPAVAIDVMRAFTTAAWAFERGVERIVLTDDLVEALALKARLPGSLALKDGEPEAGFDLSNSPARMRERADLTGLTLVQRTTAGTVGAVAARTASPLYCASFVCAGATAKALRQLGDSGHVSFIVTGDDGTAEEDQAGAEYIAALLNDPSADAAPFLKAAASSRSAATLKRRVAAGELGVDPRDVDSCLHPNLFDFAMIAADEDGLLTLRRAV